MSDFMCSPGSISSVGLLMNMSRRSNCVMGVFRERLWTVGVKTTHCSPAIRLVVVLNQMNFRLFVSKQPTITLVNIGR